MPGPAIFYSPHADDSLLSMSTDIVGHIDAGRDIIVVLMTAGGSEGMRRTLNGETYGYGEFLHDPAAEGYKDIPFTAQALREARINEFKSEVGSYKNYAKGRVSVVTDVVGDPEGISFQRCKDIIAFYNQARPGASHKTMSATDPSPDHNNCGKALEALVREGVVRDARYYVHRDYEYDAAVRARNPYVSTPNFDQAAAVRRAARSYMAWNPANGSYAYGYISVRNSFDTLLANPRSLVHA